MRYLISVGSTINLIDNQGDTSLHSACRTGDLNLVKQFFHPITKIDFNLSVKLNYKVSANNVNFRKFILNERNFEGEYYWNKKMK